MYARFVCLLAKVSDNRKPSMKSNGRVFWHILMKVNNATTAGISLALQFKNKQLKLEQLCEAITFTQQQVSVALLHYTKPHIHCRYLSPLNKPAQKTGFRTLSPLKTMNCLNRASSNVLQVQNTAHKITPTNG